MTSALLGKQILRKPMCVGSHCLWILSSHRKSHLAVLRRHMTKIEQGTEGKKAPSHGVLPWPQDVGFRTGPQKFTGTALVHVALASSLSRGTLLSLHLLIRTAGERNYFTGSCAGCGHSAHLGSCRFWEPSSWGHCLSLHHILSLVRKVLIVCGSLNSTVSFLLWRAPVSQCGSLDLQLLFSSHPLAFHNLVLQFEC